MSEYSEYKKNLLGSLEAVAQHAADDVSVVALIDTQDLTRPFELRRVSQPGAKGREGQLVNQRLFDSAFLDFGFHEVLDGDHCIGISYVDLEYVFDEENAIGVAPFDYFNPQSLNYIQADDMDDIDDESDDEAEYAQAARFHTFLQLVRNELLYGFPVQDLDYEAVPQVIGFLFKYPCTNYGAAEDVIAFMRVQPMWIQKKSANLLFTQGSEAPEYFSDRSIKLGSKFDFVLFDGQAAFRSITALQGVFGFKALARQRAKEFAEVLDHLVSNFDKLDERISECPTVANKILKIQKNESPVVDLDASELEYRVRRIGYYSGKVHFDDESRAILNTNQEVNNFLKVLDDALLVSPLTNIQYESRNKKRLETADNLRQTQQQD